MQTIFIMSKFTAQQIQQLNQDLKTPQEVLKWSLDNLHPSIAMASELWCRRCSCN